MGNHFGIWDYFGVGLLLVLTAIIGLYFSRKNKSNDDLLLGGRKLNHWPVALSVMASYISAVTVIGFPAEIYGYGVEIFNMAIVALICFPTSVAIFVPFLYSLKLTSIFEVLTQGSARCVRIFKKIQKWTVFPTPVLQAQLFNSSQRGEHVELQMARQTPFKFPKLRRLFFETKYGHGIQTKLGKWFWTICKDSCCPYLDCFKCNSCTPLYVELRFGCPSLRRLISGIYIFEQVALAGVILYGPSLVLDTFLAIPTWVSIFGIGALCTLYTCAGGLKAVVWTDALQAIIMVAGMIAIMIKAFINAGGVGQSFEISKENGRLDLIQIRFNIFERHNFFNFYLGFAFTTLFRSTVHQQQIQRLSSQPSLSEAQKVMILSVPITLTVKIVGVLTGIAVFATYYNCDPVKLGKVKTIDHIVPYFVVTEMSHIPGVLGLFVACIFSGVLSSISSSLNSLTAVTWEDFLSKMPTFAKMSTRGQANVSRVTGLLYGVISVTVAFSAQYMGSVYSASYQVVGASSGVVTAVFIAGFFIPFINATGVKFGAIVGYATMLTIGIRNIFSTNLKPPFLPTSIENCDENILASANFTASALPQTKFEVDWPDKLFTLSYLMYPLAGAIVTLTVATVTSLLTGGIQKANSIPPKYLHPFIRPVPAAMEGQEGRSKNKEKPNDTLETNL